MNRGGLRRLPKHRCIYYTGVDSPTLNSAPGYDTVAGVSSTLPANNGNPHGRVFKHHGWVSTLSHGSLLFSMLTVAATVESPADDGNHGWVPTSPISQANDGNHGWVSTILPANDGKHHGRVSVPRTQYSWSDLYYFPCQPHGNHLLFFVVRTATTMVRSLLFFALTMATPGYCIGEGRTGAQYPVVHEPCHWKRCSLSKRKGIV
jgi:hypothetical protein